MSKPPYRVPLMSEIEAIPHNGFNVVSTFSGCGGSCLGYRIAGFKVLWANEVFPISQQSYKTNHSSSILDLRDIRNVAVEDILQATGLEQGELDLFDGSPPCTEFSTAGKREKAWGKTKKHSGITQRVDDLFFEYVRLLDGLQPKTFVAENVSGLVKGTAKGYFKIILQALKDCGYRVEAQLLDASWLGVPQARQRVIFVGVRNDLNKSPVFPKPLPYQYTLHDAIRVNNERFRIDEDTRLSPFYVKIWHECQATSNKQHPKYFNYRTPFLGKPSPTICTHEATWLHPDKPRNFAIDELKRICAFPDDFILVGSYAEQAGRLGNSVPPVMMYHIASAIRDNVL